MNRHKTKTAMKAHPISQILPEINTADLQALAENIASEGQKEDIVLHDGQILDGRSRFAACKLKKVEPRTREFGSRKTDGDDPLKFVLAENVHRRHLSDEQRALIAGELAMRSEQGRPKAEETNGEPAVKQEEAAKLLNVSPAAVRRATKLAKKGGTKLKEAVRSGEISLSKAAAAADAPKEKQLKKAKTKAKGPKLTAKTKLLGALDVFWAEKGKALEAPPMCQPKDMMRYFRKLIEKVL